MSSSKNHWSVGLCRDRLGLRKGAGSKGRNSRTAIFPLSLWSHATSRRGRPNRERGDELCHRENGGMERLRGKGQAFAGTRKCLSSPFRPPSLTAPIAEEDSQVRVGGGRAGGPVPDLRCAGAVQRGQGLERGEAPCPVTCPQCPRRSGSRLVHTVRLLTVWHNTRRQLDLDWLDWLDWLDCGAKTGHRRG